MILNIIFLNISLKNNMAEGKPLKIGTRVKVIGKDDIGTVQYVGTTLFQTGKIVKYFLEHVLYTRYFPMFKLISNIHINHLVLAAG